MANGVIPGQIRVQIVSYLRNFMANSLGKIRPVARQAQEFRPTRLQDAEGDVKPFHEALVPEGVLRTSDFERSFSTSLGTSFEEVAKLIGSSRFRRSERGFKFQVSIPRVALDTIDGVISDVSSDGMRGRYTDFANSVASAYRGDLISRRALTIDLYLERDDGTEYYFEMKSPKPNKDQSVGAVRKLLTVHGAKGIAPPRLQTYYSMAYNPYGDSRSDYAESIARKYLDLNAMVLMGQEFWDFVGGGGCYEDVLDIFQEVGQEFGPQVWDLLAGPA